MSSQASQFRSRYLILAVASLAVGQAGHASAATFTFIPQAGSTPTPAGTANWADGSSWVNTAGSLTGTVPGAADVAGSSTAATTIVNSAVPTVNDVRFANAIGGTTVATLNGSPILAAGEATLEVQTGGTLTVQSTNGTANGGILIGRAQPSGGKLILSGGTINTGSTAAITNDSPGNIVIGDLASGSGAANSTFTITAGTANIGNNLILANGFNAAGATKGTVTQSGGIVNVAGAVQVGTFGTGVYTITGGQLNQLGTQIDGAPLGRDAFFVGRNANGVGNAGASGTFIQSGTAAVSIANGLYVANNNNTVGSYTVAGGTLAIAGEIKVGASTNSGGVVTSTNNVGSFRIEGNAAPTINANRLTADTTNSTLGFAIDSSSGATLLNLIAGSGFTGNAILSADTHIDLDTLGGFMPISGSTFELLRATSINVLPTLTVDGDAFDSATLAIRDNGNGTQSLIATVPEPTAAAFVGLGLLLSARRKRTSR